MKLKSTLFIFMCKQKLKSPEQILIFAEFSGKESARFEHEPKSRKRAKNRPPEKVFVSEPFLERPGPELRKHNAKRHKTRANRIMRDRTPRPRTGIEHVKHIAGETEAVAELFNNDT